VVCDICDKWFHWGCVGLKSAPREKEASLLVVECVCLYVRMYSVPRERRTIIKGKREEYEDEDEGEEEVEE
jgi:hypothetical protein